MGSGFMGRGISLRPWWLASSVVFALLLLCIPCVAAADQPDPMVPQELSGKAGMDHVDLAWFQPAQGTAGLENYSVYRGSGPEDMERIDNVTVNLTAYHDGDLVEGTTYFYYVTSWYDGTESAPSNALAMTTGTEPERENLATIGVVLAIVISAIALQIAVVAIWVIIRRPPK